TFFVSFLFTMPWSIHIRTYAVGRLSAKQEVDLADDGTRPPGFVLVIHVACVTGPTTRQTLFNNAGW
ncbi:MAG: hypothetical protein ACYTAO_18320, partial [Planctomycetota bacterium]